MSDMMTTQAGDAGAFRNFDLSRVPTPCFVVDEKAVERNLTILSDIGTRSGAHVLSALKAFSMFSLAPLVRQHLGGTCASGIYEARLGREEYGGEVATFCAGYKDADMDEILSLSDHIIFNSPAQKTASLPKPKPQMCRSACASIRNIPKARFPNTIPARPARAWEHPSAN